MHVVRDSQPLFLLFLFSYFGHKIFLRPNRFLTYLKKRKPKTSENESWELETLNRKPTLHESVTLHHFPVPGPSPDSSALTGDRARERGAENCADVRIHLIKHSQELGAGKYGALYIVSLSVYFRRRKKRKNRENWGKERERERKRRFTPRATHNIGREKR